MLTVITGGSGSGKSEYAENYMLSEKKKEGNSNRDLIYLATMIPFDQECEKRIQRHRTMRAEKQFTTMECFTDLNRLRLEKNPIVLLECMSNLVANEMYQENGAQENTVGAIIQGIKHLEEMSRHLVIVTNEVFSDGGEYDPETKRYLAYLGEINQEMGKIADCVIEVVYSVPIITKICTTK